EALAHRRAAAGGVGSRGARRGALARIGSTYGEARSIEHPAVGAEQCEVVAPAAWLPEDRLRGAAEATSVQPEREPRGGGTRLDEHALTPLRDVGVEGEQRAGGGRGDPRQSHVGRADAL